MTQLLGVRESSLYATTPMNAATSMGNNLCNGSPC
jgi:hypothetical protein